jgi:hypothetical protein
MQFTMAPTQNAREPERQQMTNMLCVPRLQFAVSESDVNFLEGPSPIDQCLEVVLTRAPRLRHTK